MIEKKTVLDRIEIDSSGVVQIRLGLLILEDGNEIDRKWHRTSIPLDVDPDTQIDEVNSHLQQMQKLPVTSSDREQIKRVVKAARPL